MICRWLDYIHSKFHHFCQQAYNLIDSSNLAESSWIAADDIEFVCKDFISSKVFKTEQWNYPLTKTCLILEKEL